MEEFPRLLVVTDLALMGPDPVATVRGLLGNRPADASGPAGTPDGRRSFGSSPVMSREPRSPRWMLQWRDKVSSTRETYARLLALGDTSGVPVVVNDRIDLALALGHGVHLTEGSLPTRIARSLLPAGALIGRSTHDLESALRADAEGADYVVFGPVFDTPSKRSYGEPLGLEALAGVTRVLRIPVFAIGGIGPAEVEGCLRSGAHGVALIRAVWAAPSPGQALEQLLGSLAGARKTGPPA